MTAPLFVVGEGLTEEEAAASPLVVQVVDLDDAPIHGLVPEVLEDGGAFGFALTCRRIKDRILIASVIVAEPGTGLGATAVLSHMPLHHAEAFHEALGAFIAGTRQGLVFEAVTTFQSASDAVPPADRRH